MEIIAIMLTAIVVLIHTYICWFEMFSWENTGKKVFGASLADDLFKPTKGLAANQGIYNGMLALGLVVSYFLANQEAAFTVRIFFLVFVVIVGIYGAISASKKIFFVQALPALLAILAQVYIYSCG